MHFDVWYERPAATEECHGGMCVDVDRVLGKSWWPDVCHLSQGAHTPYTRGIPWVKSPERVRLTGGRACWRERGHSYRSISSYRKLPPPACPGTTCIYGESQLCEGSGLSGFCQTLFFSENGWLNDEVGEGMVGTGALIGHVFLRDQSRL